MNGKFHYVGSQKGRAFRYSKAKWSQLMQRLDMNRKRAETRVALSKAVFYRVAAELKLKQYSQGWQEVSELRRAYLKAGGMGSSGKKGPKWGTRKVVHTYKNFTDRKKPVLNFYIRSTNTFNPTTQGAGKLQAALNGQQRRFEELSKRGVLDTAEGVAKEYGGLIKVKG